MAGARSIGVVQKEIVDLFAELAELDPLTLTSGEMADYAIESQRIRRGRCPLCSVGGRGRPGEGVVDRRGEVAHRVACLKAGIAKGRATAAVVGARDLRNMPLAEAAMLAGTITADHVRRLADAYGTNPEEYTDDEARLVGIAELPHYSRFDRVIRYWCMYAAPDDAEDESGRRRSAMRTAPGPWTGWSRSTHARPSEWRDLRSGARAAGAGVFEEDVAEAKVRVGREFALTELRRTPRQRRADALALMAARSAAKPPDATEPRILLQALVGEDSLRRMCELSNRQVVTPGELLPLLEWADIERICSSRRRGSRRGVRQRIFRGATKTAVLVRDLECTHPSCDVPAERCEIDHIVPFADGGLTVHDNGRCRCKYHHRRTPPSP